MTRLNVVNVIEITKRMGAGEMQHLIFQSLRGRREPGECRLWLRGHPEGQEALLGARLIFRIPPTGAARVRWP